MTTQKKPESVYAKIAAVQAELAKVGISKSRKNQAPGASYNFRGIDEVYNTLAPLMADHGLCILPRIVEHKMEKRGETRNGNTIFAAIVTAEFDFVSADDGSIHVVRTMGEAMDSSDKATNKAMSAAYKYAALMTFAIPTEGDNDADAHTPEVVSTAAASPPKREPAPKLISDSDWAILTTLIEATGSDAKKLCDYYKVAATNKLTVEQAQHAIVALNNKLKPVPQPADDLADDAAFLKGE